MTIKFNVQFEVPFEVTDEQLHEDLCKTLHEDQGTTIGYINIGLPDEEPTYNTNVAITEWDNRDPATTWLWIDKVRYIEVNPVELIANMVENCHVGMVEFEDVTEDQLNHAVSILKRAIGS